MTTANMHDFTMDPNLLVSVIKSQAGTLSKALLEGVMNSIDAGAKSIEITLVKEGFTLKDNGRGFSSEEEVKLWFGRFGTPHTEGDAMFGRFRMGRGQMMAFAATEWRSGPFKMRVDIENKGLAYELERLDTAVPGCTIEGRLYQPLPDYKMATLLAEFKTFVAFSPVPVYVNGVLYGAPAAKSKRWAFEDEYAYYKLSQDSRELAVYNQGIFVEQMGSWRIGMGGTIVSKQPLLVNFARNSVMEERCTVWARISANVEQMVLTKLLEAKKLTDSERNFLARHLRKLKESLGGRYKSAKLLTDPTGKHLPLGDLVKYKRFVYTPQADTRACAMQGQDGTFVVLESLLERFAVNSLEEFLAHLKEIDESLVPLTYEISKLEQLSALEVNRVSMLDATGLARKRFAAYTALKVLNEKLADALIRDGAIAQKRQLLVGKHKGTKFVAWTDGNSYITANERFLKLFDLGQDGVHQWVLTLFHEYTHDTDDSESHSHGEVFYRKFHDTLFASGASPATLTQIALAAYLGALRQAGLAQPNRLKRQLSVEQRKCAAHAEQEASGTLTLPSFDSAQGDEEEVVV